jgi:hypothetical protein
LRAHWFEIYGQSGDLYFPGGQIDEEQHQIARQSLLVQISVVKKSDPNAA